MLKYIGRGEYLVGVPARDLTDKEVDQYGGKEELLATGLYIEIKPAAKETITEKEK